MFSFSTGLSGLRASQIGLDIVAQNIANANTPGYHRQSVSLADRSPIPSQNLLVGTGVDVARIRQIRHAITEGAITRNLSDAADVSGRLDVMRQIESYLTPTTGSLYDRLQTLLNDFEQLSTEPDSLALRRTVVQAASSLAGEINRVGDSLIGLRADVEQEVETGLRQVNATLHAIAALNRQINIAEGRGLEPFDLRDRRDQLTNEVAQLIDVHIEEQGPGQTVLILGDGSSLVGSNFVDLEVKRGSEGELVITHADNETPIQFNAGRLAGLMAAHDQIVGGYLDDLDTFTKGLVSTIDGVHTAGVGTSGPFELLNGVRGVSDVSALLAAAGLSFPLQAGELTIGVTDSATGQRTLHTIAIDPATDSLQDLAASIAAVDHIQAVVDNQTGALTVIAEAGFAFDFTGHLETTPDTAGITGTTTPAVHGAYTGTANDQFNFEFLGSGSVGVTPGLQLEVRQANGDLVTILDVGQGYSPDSLLAIADGVSVSLGTGTAAVGDTFATALVAQPDTAGVLTALGLNTLFTGSSVTDIAVRQQIIDQPESLATSRTGQVGEQLNLQALIALRDMPLVADGTASAEDFVANLVFTAGSEVASLSQLENNLESLAVHLETERQSVSGVDPNEELVYMLQFQRSFQAAARYIAALDESLDDLFRIIR